MPKQPPKPAPDLTTPEGLKRVINEWYNRLDPVLIYELKDQRVKDRHIKFAIGYLLTHNPVLTLKAVGHQGKPETLNRTAYDMLAYQSVRLALTKLKPVLHARRGSEAWLKQKLEEIVEYCPAWEHKVKAAEIYAKILGLVRQKGSGEKKEEKSNFKGVVLTPSKPQEEK